MPETCIAAARAMHGLAKRADVRVIVHGDMHPNQIPQPGAKWKIVPAFDLVRAANLAGAGINRAAKSNTRSDDLISPLPFPQRLADLLADSLAAPA